MTGNKMSVNKESDMYVMSGNTVVAAYSDADLQIINEDLAPLYLKRTHDFYQWVSERAVDPNRPNARVLKRLHGLSMLSSDYETALLYNAACVTDNFWVKKSPDEQWEDIRFTDDVYFKAAVSSDIDAFGKKASRSPELTNIGSLEKGWKLIDGEWWLYKNESEEKARAEILTNRLGMVLGFDMAQYEVKDGFVRSKDVTKGIYNLQHIDGIIYDHDGVNEEDIRYNYMTLNNISPEISKSYMNMKYLDALVNNVDRHKKNYALLTSQQTGEIVALAPNYDNDMSFYGYPDILSESANRMNGEIRYFVEALSDISYEPPVIDEKALDEILRGYDQCEGLKRYILRGQEIVFDHVIKKERLAEDELDM